MCCLNEWLFYIFTFYEIYEVFGQFDTIFGKILYLIPQAINVIASLLKARLVFIKVFKVGEQQNPLSLY